MKVRLLAIDKDIENYNRQSKYWLKYDVEPTLISSIQEGLEKISKEQNHIAIGINADSINYKPRLRILRDCTTSPIHIITSGYTIDELEETLLLGADSYSKWQTGLDESTRRGLAQFLRYGERNSESENIHGGI